jgi:hypothetical protein
MNRGRRGYSVQILTYDDNEWFFSLEVGWVWTQHWTLRFLKIPWISLTAEQLLACKEGLCSMEFVWTFGN